MENIYNQREQFTGLMEMNKTLLMECARLFNKKNPRDIFDMRLREKTNEFNNFTKSAPPEIDFTDSRTFNASDNVDDLLWTATPDGETAVKKVLDKFNVRKVEEDNFRILW